LFGYAIFWLADYRSLVHCIIAHIYYHTYIAPVFILSPIIGLIWLMFADTAGRHYAIGATIPLLLLLTGLLSVATAIAIANKPLPLPFCRRYRYRYRYCRCLLISHWLLIVMVDCYCLIYHNYIAIILPLHYIAIVDYIAIAFFILATLHYIITAYCYLLTVDRHCYHRYYYIAIYIAIIVVSLWSACCYCSAYLWFARCFCYHIAIAIIRICYYIALSITSLLSLSYRHHYCYYCNPIITYIATTLPLHAYYYSLLLPIVNKLISITHITLLL
jgi:hypothetical protein